MLSFSERILKRQALAAGGLFSERLTGEGLWTELRVQCEFSAWDLTAGVVATLDGILNSITRISMRVGNTQILNLNPVEQFYRDNILSGVQAAFTQLANTTAGLIPRFVIRIPLQLPQRVWKYPDVLSTAMPAGLLGNIELNIQAKDNFATATPASGPGAIVSTGATSAGALTVSVSAVQAEVNESWLVDHVKNYGAAYFQESFDLNGIASAAEQETRIKTGRGVLMEIYARNAVNGNSTSIAGALAASPATQPCSNVRLVVGSSRYYIDSRDSDLQDETKSRFMLETRPPGAWLKCFAQHGQLEQGIPLVGVNDCRLLQTFQGSPNQAFQHVITGIVMPLFYNELLGIPHN